MRNKSTEKSRSSFTRNPGSIDVQYIILVASSTEEKKSFVMFQYSDLWIKIW